MKKKKSKFKTQYRKYATIGIILLFIVLTLGYCIHETNFLEPHIDEATTRYISFNNKKTTDRLRIKNIKKMSNRIGKSQWNKKSLMIDTEVEGEQEYQIVLYNILNTIDENYIMYSLETKNKTTSQSIAHLEETEDGGKVLYTGKGKNQRLILRLWIMNTYPNQEVENVFEIKVKPR